MQQKHFETKIFSFFLNDFRFLSNMLSPYDNEKRPFSYGDNILREKKKNENHRKKVVYRVSRRWHRPKEQTEEMLLRNHIFWKWKTTIDQFQRSGYNIKDRKCRTSTRERCQIWKVRRQDWKKQTHKRGIHRNEEHSE